MESKKLITPHAGDIYQLTSSSNSGDSLDDSVNTATRSIL